MSSVKYVAVVFVALIVSTSAPHKVESTRCERLTRSKILKLLGPAVKCSKEMKQTECFGSPAAGYRVQFNEADIVEQIVSFDLCSGVDSLKKDMDRLLSQELRGKFIRKEDLSALGACESAYEEEYECVKMKFAQNNCMGCVPASITITWKTDSIEEQAK